ncbi:MAG: hypothetical protein QW478_14425 [Candidatus Micrarchaeaceae archaeon]
MEVKFNSKFMNNLSKRETFENVVAAGFPIEELSEIDKIIGEAEKRNNPEELIGAYNKSYSLVAGTQIPSEQKKLLLERLCATMRAAKNDEVARRHGLLYPDKRE